MWHETRTKVRTMQNSLKVKNEKFAAQNGLHTVTQDIFCVADF
jgi:hypothetical protein